MYVDGSDLRAASQQGRGQYDVPFGNDVHNYGLNHQAMGKLTISMAIFNRYLSTP